MKKSSVEVLADEIFKVLQFHQGYAFVSDGLGALRNRKTLFAVVRGALKHTEASARIMRRWLRKYGELYQSTDQGVSK